jgi:putative exosortase-associated protein (TIGR04073 family)
MMGLRATAIGLFLMGVLVMDSAWMAGPANALERRDQTEAMLLRYNLHPKLEKLGRGVGNVLTGWLEFPLNIQQRYSQQDTAASLCTGAAYGLIKGAARTFVGFYEAATFLLPYPQDYAPILPTLDYFKREAKPRRPRTRD